MANKFMLVRTPDEVGMGGASCTELFCTILKNGTLSLRTCRDQYGDGGRCWVKGKRGIQTPKQFVEALEHMEDISQHFTHDEVLEVLYSKLPIFSLLTGIYMRHEGNLNGVVLADNLYKDNKGLVGYWRYFRPNRTYKTFPAGDVHLANNYLRRRTKPLLGFSPHPHTSKAL